VSHYIHSTKTAGNPEYSLVLIRCVPVIMSVTTAFSQQLVEVVPRLRRFARSLTRSAADADDLAQAAIERALVHQASWKPGTRLDSWVYRIAQNLWRDELRAHRRRSEPLEDSLMGEDGRESFARHIEVAELAQSFERLPEEQRLVLTLVVLDGLSYQETAEVLAVPIGTVMSRLARARGRLAAQMPADVGRLRAAK
jgi:RNA polymerase sigma-70 factor (ECF subfamily)